MQEFFNLLPCSDQLLGPPNLLSSGYWVPFYMDKEEDCEADRTPAYSAEVKNMCIYTLTPFTAA
jgi:hypothetical protein